MTMTRNRSRSGRSAIAARSSRPPIRDIQRSSRISSGQPGVSSSFSASSPLAREWTRNPSAFSASVMLSRLSTSSSTRTTVRGCVLPFGPGGKSGSKGGFLVSGMGCGSGGDGQGWIDGMLGDEEPHFGGGAEETGRSGKDLEVLGTEVAPEIGVAGPTAHHDEEGAGLLETDGADETAGLATNRLRER